LPTDVFERVEAKAKETGWPLNRVIINELAAFPGLEKQAKLGELIRDQRAGVAPLRRDPRRPAQHLCRTP
jgi:hypothetical protein